MTSPNRPPSCDKLTPELKECPACGDQNIFRPTAIPHKVHCYRCECYGPWHDREGHKWNSIPRIWVAELLRLVDEALTKTDYNTSDWGKYNKYADQLRKEWNL